MDVPGLFEEQQGLIITTAQWLHRDEELPALLQHWRRLRADINACYGQVSATILPYPSASLIACVPPSVDIRVLLPIATDGASSAELKVALHNAIRCGMTDTALWLVRVKHARVSRAMMLFDLLWENRPQCELTHSSLVGWQDVMGAGAVASPDWFVPVPRQVQCLLSVVAEMGRSALGLEQPSCTRDNGWTVLHLFCFDLSSAYTRHWVATSEDELLEIARGIVEGLGVNPLLLDDMDLRASQRLWQTWENVGKPTWQSDIEKYLPSLSAEDARSALDRRDRAVRAVVVYLHSAEQWYARSAVFKALS